MDPKETKPPTPEQLIADERARISGIEAFASKFIGRVANVDELKAEGIREGWSVEKFKGMCAERITDGEPVETPESKLGLTRKEQRSFSLLRLIQHRLTDGKIKADFELECSAEISKRTGVSPKGVYIPWDIQNREFSVPISGQRDIDQLRLIALRHGLNHALRALDSTTATGAAELVGNQLRPDMFIELLRNRSLAGRLGVMTLFGLVGNITLPRQTGAATWEWTGEGGTTSGSALTTGDIQLSPKEGRAFQEYTRMLLLQSTPSIELLVQNDLLSIARLGIDKAVFHGTAANNQPRGIVNESGVGSVDGTNIGWAGVVEFETDVEAGNADVAGMAYAMRPATKGILKTRQKALNQAVYLMDENGIVNGYRSEVSNQIEAGYIFFGDYSQEILAYWGNLDVLVNPYAKDTEGKTRINLYADVDCRLRQAAAISVSSNVS